MNTCGYINICDNLFLFKQLVRVKEGIIEVVTNELK